LSERDLGRITPDADIDALAPTLIGAAHLLFTEHKDSPPEREAVSLRLPRQDPRGQRHVRL